MRKLIVAIAAVLISVTGMNAQKLKTIKGDPSVLKGDKNISVLFTYDNLKVGKMEEAAYLEREIKERDDKEAGTGDVWAGKWQADKETRYPRKFIQLFNEMAGDKFDAAIDTNATDSKYTIKVNTSWIEPGYNVGVMRKPAGANMEIYIYETATPDVILHELTVLNSPGSGAMGYDFDAGFRIQESFAKAAKEYAYFCWKKYIK